MHEHPAHHSQALQMETVADAQVLDQGTQREHDPPGSSVHDGAGGRQDEC